MYIYMATCWSHGRHAKWRVGKFVGFAMMARRLLTARIAPDVCVCIYVCVYVYVCVYIYIYVCVHTYVYIYMHVVAPDV